MQNLRILLSSLEKKIFKGLYQIFYVQYVLAIFSLTKKVGHHLNKLELHIHKDYVCNILKFVE